MENKKKICISSIFQQIMLVNLKLKFKLSLVYWLNLTEFKIESKISLLRKILRNILRFGKFFCYKSPNHVQNIWLTTLFGENYDSTEFMLGLITRAEHCARFNTLFSFRLLGLIQNNKAICRYLLCFSAFECIFVDWL